MFNLDLDRPSDRRKLFILLVFLFSILVFGAKWIWGSIEEEQVEAVPEDLPPAFSSSPSQLDREEARQIAEEFIKIYISLDLKESKSLMTFDFYESELRNLKLSRINQDEDLSVVKTHSSIIQDYYLEEQGKVKVTVWATIKSGKDSYEVPYWITLNSDTGSWLVEGVELGDYPEGE